MPSSGNLAGPKVVFTYPALVLATVPTFDFGANELLSKFLYEFLLEILFKFISIQQSATRNLQSATQSLWKKTQSAIQN